MRRYILAGIFLLSISYVFGQPVDTARFHLEYTPRLMSINKIPTQAVIQDTLTEKVQFDYYIVPQRLDVEFKPNKIQYSKVSPEALEKMYRNFLKVGFGYPVTPLVDFSFHNLQNQKYSFGAALHHFSYWCPQVGKTMKQYPNSPLSDTRAHLHFKRFFKHQTLYSALNYNHEAARFYGFKVAEFPAIAKDSLKNNFHHLKAQVGIASNYLLGEKKLKQDVQLNYDFLRNNWKDMENHVGLKSFFAYDARWVKISGSQCYRLNLDVDYYNNRWLEGASDHTLLLNPELFAHFTIKEYHILVGLGGVIERNGGKTGGTVYPIAELQLGLIPSILNIYAGVGGDAKHNSLKDLLYENPFIKPHLDTLCTTLNYINIYGGVKGNLVKKLNYNLSAHYSYAKNLAFFCLDTAASHRNQFNVVYHNGNVLNVDLDVNYEVIKNLRLTFGANYQLYALSDSTATAFHKPKLAFSFNGQYILHEKFVFDLNFNLSFGRKTLAYDDFFDKFTIQKMKPILDFGVGFEYLINDHFAAFATINNLACQYYSKYYDFKSFGINALVGVTYSFGHEALKKSKKKTNL